jgi:hypothetical protein
MAAYFQTGSMIRIRPIDDSDYNISRMYRPIYRELAWYATADDAVLGGVILDLVDFDYSYIVMTMNEQGVGYTAVDGAVSLTTEDAATEALFAAMVKEARQPLLPRRSGQKGCS